MNEQYLANPKEKQSVKLSIKSLSKTYQVKGVEISVLSDINLEIYEGEFVAIVGGSGCGKSTFLRIVSGFIQDYVGKAQINGSDIHAPGRDRGFVFQESRLFPWLTVEENISFGRENKHEKNTTTILVTHDIEEAIFLADRVIVMTPRPGKIHKIIPVNLYHPRNRNESAFVEIRKHIYNEFFTPPKQEIEYSI